MKVLKYYIANEVNCGTTENPEYKDILFKVEMPWSEANEEIVKREAYNGEYTIVDNGIPLPVVEPTADDVLNALLGVK